MGTQFQIATPSGRGTGKLSDSFGPVFFVDTINGLAGNSGLTPDKALTTIEAVFTKLLAMATADADSANNATIYVVGTIAEQLTAPLGVSGCRIIGLANGRNRHDDGARWKEEASAAGAPLLIVHEQGWEFHNILFVPETGYSALRLWRAEDATHPDGSHGVYRNCKFIGNTAIGTPAGIGIEDWGGTHHYLVDDCEFCDLEFAIVAPAGSPGIAAPLRDTIQNCFFSDNKHDICMDMSRGRIIHNYFNTAYHGTTHPNIVNLAYLSDVSGKNVVCENYFPDAITAIDDDHGYVESTGDVWANNWASTATSAASGAPWGGVPADS